MADDWSEIGPSQITGWGSRPDGGSGGVTAGVESAVTTAGASGAPWYSPDNPLFWFGALAVLATGAIVTSSSVDVGKLRLKEKS